MEPRVYRQESKLPYAICALGTVLLKDEELDIDLEYGKKLGLQLTVVALIFTWLRQYQTVVERF